VGGAQRIIGVRSREVEKRAGSLKESGRAIGLRGPGPSEVGDSQGVPPVAGAGAGAGAGAEVEAEAGAEE